MPKRSPKPEEEFISSKDAAIEAGVVVDTIHDWINKGYLRARRKGIGRTSPYLIYRSSWEKFLRDREINTDLDEE